MIKVGLLSDEDTHYQEPDSRVAMLGHAALDYFRASVVIDRFQWQEDGMPFFYFLLPTMHQTIELIAKGIAYKALPNFDSKKYSHRTLALMEDHAASVPVFASISQDANNADLLRALEKCYLGVRYGECYLSYDGQAWSCYVAIAESLFNDLSVRTGLRFPYGTP